MRVNRAVCYVRVPSDMILTPRILLAAMRKLPVDDIETTIQELIFELDDRSGDPDCEPEPYEGGDPDEDGDSDEDGDPDD